MKNLPEKYLASMINRREELKVQLLDRKDIASPEETLMVNGAVKALTVRIEELQKSLERQES